MNRALIVIFMLLSGGLPESVLASGTGIERDNLRSVTSVQVAIAPIADWIEQHGTTRQVLRTMLETGLSSATVKISDTEDPTGGVLNLTILGFKADNPSVYFYFSRVAFVQRVRLPDGRFTPASTWEDDTFGATADAGQSTTLLNSSVTASLEKFISDFKESKSLPTENK